MNKNLSTPCLGRSVTRLALSTALGAAMLLLPSAARAAVGDVDGFNPSLNGGTAYGATVQPDGRILLGANYSTGLTRVLDNGSFDPGFSIIVNGPARCIVVQPDGKILFGGNNISTVGGTNRSYIARVNPDGTVDASFNANCNGTVNSILLQPDGKILIGGNFSSVGGQFRNRLAQIDSNGVVQAGFNLSTDGEIRSMAMQADGRILLIGGFSALGGRTRPQFGRLNTDGTLDTNFNVSVSSGGISAVVVQPDGKILVGGNFTGLAGGARTNLGRLLADGALDTNFTGNINVWVRSLALQADGKILAGGWTTSGGFAIPAFAKLDANGTVETNFSPAISGGVLQSLDLQADGRLIIGSEGPLSVNGQQRRSFARLLNEPAVESVVIGANRVQWLRGGSAPEVRRITFELSTNGGVSHTLLGGGTRISGGWELTGVTLPAAGYVRARGHTSGGYFNNSSGLVEAFGYFGALTATNLSAAETYVEDTPLDLADIRILSGDGTNATATLTLSTPGAGSLSTATSGSVTSTYNAINGVWAASGPMASVNALLAAVTFNPATNFNAGFTIATSLSDGSTTLNGVKAMAGTPVNDALTATNVGAAESYVEDVPLNLLDIVITELDGEPVTATLTLDLPGAGRLSTGTSGAVTSTYNATSGVWRASGPVADVNALLAGLSFIPATNSFVNCRLAVSVTDGVSAPITNTRFLTGIAVLDWPTAVNASAPETYVEDTPLNLIDIVVSDPDSGVNVSLTVSPPEAGSLSAGTSGGVSSTYNQISGVWSAVGPVSNINELLANVVFTPAPNYVNYFQIRVSVFGQDGAGGVLGAKEMVVLPVNDPPTLSALVDPAPINEDAGMQVVLFNGVSAGGGESQTLVVTATSGNTNVIPNPTVSYTSPGINGSLVYTPVANASGSAVITVTVNDGGASNNITTRTFTVVVNAVNDPPTLTALGNPVPINEDAGMRTVNLSGVSAGGGESQTLVVTATSGNTNLIPNPTVTYTSPNTSGSLSYTPVANASGSAVITVTLNDGGASNNITTRTFTVVVNAVNDPPTLTALINPAPINEDAGTQTVSFSGVSAGGGESQTLVVTATSGNTNLIRNPTVTYTSPGIDGSLSYTPVANASGSTVIRVTVNDGGTSNNVTTQTFTVVVNPVNDPPMLTAPGNPAPINEDAGTQTVNFGGILAGGGESQTLVVTATSGNTNLIPNPTVTYTSPGNSGSLSYTPVVNASGTAIITVTVNDGGTSNNVTTRTFSVVVNPVNDPPTLNSITSLALAQNAGLQTVGLTGISAGGGEAQVLSVTASSGNTSVIPHPTVSYTSPATNGSLSFTPVANASGSALITVTVNDGAASNNVVTRTFTVTVSAGPGEIGVEQPAGTPLSDGGARNFGSISVGRQASLAFIVTNSGPASLTNLGVTLGGADAGEFTLLFPQSYGTLVLTSSPPVHGNPFGVTVADVNGDGRPDLISVSPVTSSLTVMTNDGTGSFVLASTPATGVLPIAVLAADVNGDGRVDLVSANDAGGTLSILTNSGNGGFVLSSSPLVGPHVSAVAAGDMNGDGVIDLVAAYRGEFFANTTLVVLTNRAGLFTVAATPVVEPLTVSLAVGDFNGDGRMDLVSLSAETAALTVLTNSGAGFAAAVPPAPGLPVTSVTTADVNGDGRPDLLCPYYFGVLVVMTNNGLGSFVKSSAPTLSSNLKSVTTADLNGDGRLDALAIDTDASLLVVATNGGGGLFATAYSRAVGGSPYGVAAADVNGDGMPDAMTANYNDRTLSVLFNTPAAGATNLPPTLAAGGSTTFTVRFAPGTIGLKTAALHLTSSDTDENPYDIVLTGTGTIALTPPGIDPRSLQWLPDGSFRFTFTNAPGVAFTVLASTNIALPRASWTPLGAPVEIQPGRYQFTQPPAPQVPPRYFLLRSP